MHELIRAHGVANLKSELKAEKERYTSTQAKNTMLLAKANKWEDEAIDKKEKLSHAISKLNSNMR